MTHRPEIPTIPYNTPLLWATEKGASASSRSLNPSWFCRSPKRTFLFISVLADGTVHSMQWAQSFFITTIFQPWQWHLISMNEWMAPDAIKATVQWQLSVWITSTEPVCCIYIPDTLRSTVHSLYCSSDTMLFKWREKETENAGERKRINSPLIQPGGGGGGFNFKRAERGWRCCTSPLHLDFNIPQMKESTLHFRMQELTRKCGWACSWDDIFVLFADTYSGTQFKSTSSKGWSTFFDKAS